MSRTIFEELFSDYNFFGGFEPIDSAKIDVEEFDDKIVVTAEVYGFKKDEIEITYEKGSLTLCGEVKKEEKEKSKFLHKEIGSKTFCRKFKLGDAFDTEGIDAIFTEGVLTVTLPKSEKQKLRTITIN